MGSSDHPTSCVCVFPGSPAACCCSSMLLLAAAISWARISSWSAALWVVCVWECLGPGMGVFGD